MDYIGISENKVKHMLGVARKCYKISKEMGQSEEFARKMFVIGYNHDIGYEFSTKNELHNYKSYEMLKTLGIECESILHHGELINKASLEWLILNQADLQVNSKGEDVGVEGRLYDIKIRYGENSKEYINAIELAHIVGLKK